MRRFAFFFIACVALPVTVAAQQSTTPGYTPFDQQQFAKLRATVGTWQCVDIPASKNPDMITTTQNGNWFVSKETGDFPGKSYTRWSHRYRLYITFYIGDQGNASIMQTTSKDPDNAVWKYGWPTSTPSGNALQPMTTSLSGKTQRTSGSFYDTKGKLHRYSSVCTKK